MAYFSQTAHAITPRGIGKIKSLTIRLFITDCSGEVFFTDMLFDCTREDRNKHLKILTAVFSVVDL